MNLSLIILLISLFMSLTFTPIAIRLNILDKPNYRKIHTKPIPKAGGIGIFIPIIIISFWYYNRYGLSTSQLSTFFILFYLMIVGIIDDKIELSSKTKLIFQILAGILSIYMNNMLKLTGIYIIDALLTVLWIVGIINAVNLIDGLDGLASGIGIVTSSAFAFIGYLTKDYILLYFSLAIVGSLLGFLKYNFMPAKIFMGDTGSLPLGYILSIFSIKCMNSIGGLSGVSFSIIVLGVPIYDTLLSILRRYLNRKPIFAPDRSHFYNLLMDVRGLEHKKTVFTIYVINIILIMLAVVLININVYLRVVEILAILAFTFISTYKLKFIKVDQ